MSGSLAKMASKNKRRDLFMGDEYWDESDKRITPFDFDDDADAEGYTFMRKFKEMQVHTEPSEEEEIIGWDGKPINVSESITAASSAAAPPTRLPGAMPSVSLSAGSVRSPTDSPAVRSIASSSAAGDSRSLTDALTSVSAPPPDPGQLSAEVSFLRRRLAEARQVAPPAGDTARRLTLGEACPLELYRALADKRQLLAETVALGDGDAVLAVVLFLKRTLKRSLFLSELRRQPSACEQYLAYLRARFSSTDAADLLAVLGRAEEAALVRYESAVRTRGGVEPQLRALQQCLQAHLAADPDLALHAGLVRQQLDLLERQRPVEAADAALRSDVQLVGRSVLSTLHYCCLHHYDEPANHLASPLALRERHQLTEEQYVWTALRARASLQAWADVQALFTNKTWFSSGKLRPVVPFKAAVEVLESFGASPDILSLYIASIDGTEARLEHAKKFGCYKIVVDGYLSQKDRAALEQYRSTLKPQSAAHLYASDALRATTVRWKN